MWAERCYKAHTRDDQALFGIVQGGMHLDLRLRSLRHLEECGDFPGYGIGGYSVGEDHETMFETLAPLASEYMPKHKPRYLMGVGNPTTLVLVGTEYWQGLFNWLNGPVMDAGMISPLDPDLVHITDDLNEAVDIALSGLM